MYPEVLQILIVGLQNSVLSKATFHTFAVSVSWLPLAGLTATYNKTMDSVTFSLVNGKKFLLSKKNFAKILGIPNAAPFYKVTNDQILYMFNEIGY